MTGPAAPLSPDEPHSGVQGPGYPDSPVYVPPGLRSALRSGEITMADVEALAEIKAAQPVWPPPIRFPVSKLPRWPGGAVHDAEDSTDD